MSMPHNTGEAKMMDYKWDEAFERIDDMGVEIFRWSPTLATEMLEIRKLLTSIMIDTHNDLTDLNSLIAAFEGIYTRHYAKEESYHDDEI
jgi:hypothetical protein